MCTTARRRRHHRGGGLRFLGPTKTETGLLDAIAGVFAYARDLGLVDESPVPGFRKILKRRRGTQRGRAERDPGRDVHPIADAADLAHLEAEARAEGASAHALVLLLLDAGLRLGEALGLRWGHVQWGDGPDDPRRGPLVRESRSGGGEPGPTKSGRARRVHLSRRLRRTLHELYEDRWRPGPEEHVLPGLDPANFRHREWRRIVKRADLPGVRMKDLRDTFSSQLLTCGVQLGYVSAQLGHADVAITAKHYARWIEADEYREPLQVRAGEVPADLLARLDEQSPHTPPTWLDAGLGTDEGHDVSTDVSSGTWRARHDSNVRPLGSQPARPRRETKK